jgi:EpsI family protein
VTKLAAALAFLALNFYTYHYMAREAVVPPREVFAGFPMTLEGWSCSEQGTVDPEVWRGLGATDLFLCGYSNEEEGAHVSVYVGYHATQIREEGGGAGENSIHPPAHCLPGAGWDIIDNQTVALQIPELPTQDGRAKRLIVAKGEARQLVYYWYQSRGRVIAEDWQKIVYVGWDRATRGRTDGSLVRFMVPIVRGDVERAEREFREIAELVVGELSSYVPI